MEINKVRLQTNPTVIQAGSIYKFRLKKKPKKTSNILEGRTVDLIVL